MLQVYYITCPQTHLWCRMDSAGESSVFLCLLHKQQTNQISGTTLLQTSLKINSVNPQWSLQQEGCNMALTLCPLYDMNEILDMKFSSSI